MRNASIVNMYVRVLHDEPFDWVVANCIAHRKLLDLCIRQRVFTLHMPYFKKSFDEVFNFVQCSEKVN